MTKVLFVCLANICRSAAAEGVLKHIAEKEGISDQIFVESCGVGDWRIGELADPRLRAAAWARGIVIATRARQFKEEYLESFDYILAADHEILKVLHHFAKSLDHKAKIHLITAFGSSYQGIPLPDPYYEGDAAFEHILDVLEDACQGLLKEIQKKPQKS